MKNITCKSLRHLGMWLPQQPVSAFAGTFANPSIRSYNDEGQSGSFIEGSGYC